jgi:hypothetical protein
MTDERDPDELPEPTDPQGAGVPNDEAPTPPDDGDGEAAAGTEPTDA